MRSVGTGPTLLANLSQARAHSNLPNIIPAPSVPPAELSGRRSHFRLAKNWPKKRRFLPVEKELIVRVKIGYNFVTDFY